MSVRLVRRINGCTIPLVVPLYLSVVLPRRQCSCPGCTALAVQGVRMAHVQTARLLARVEQRQTPSNMSGGR